MDKIIKGAKAAEVPDLEQRMRKYLQERRQIKGFRFRRWPSARLNKEFGLYAIPRYPRIGALACVEMKTEQPTELELVINLRAAKQISVMVPLNVLARADRIIKGVTMAELDTGKPVSLEELMVTTLAMADAVTKLLIEKGVITDAEFKQKLLEERAVYHRQLFQTGESA